MRFFNNNDEKDYEKLEKKRPPSKYKIGETVRLIDHPEIDMEVIEVIETTKDCKDNYMYECDFICLPHFEYFKDRVGRKWIEGNIFGWFIGKKGEDVFNPYIGHPDYCRARFYENKLTK